VLSLLPPPLQHAVLHAFPPLTRPSQRPSQRPTQRCCKQASKHAVKYATLPAAAYGVLLLQLRRQRRAHELAPLAGGCSEVSLQASRASHTARRQHAVGRTLMMGQPPLGGAVGCHSSLRHELLAMGSEGHRQPGSPHQDEARRLPRNAAICAAAAAADGLGNSNTPPAATATAWV
jgi:hypothetical protein